MQFDRRKLLTCLTAAAGAGALLGRDSRPFSLPRLAHAPAPVRSLPPTRIASAEPIAPAHPFAPAAQAAKPPLHPHHAHAVETAQASPPAAPAVTRRSFLSQGSGGDIRQVALHNLHTGDKLQAVYWENGDYVPDALAQAQRVLRDWRNGEEHFMDPRLFDVMDGISRQLGTAAPFQIISGYRSPQTNAMLHERSAGVASHSQHMLGKASDIRIQGVELVNLRRAALSLQAGGVGFYPVSNFVHVDVGPKRTWQGA